MVGRLNKSIHLIKHWQMYIRNDANGTTEVRIVSEYFAHITFLKRHVKAKERDLNGTLIDPMSYKELIVVFY